MPTQEERDKMIDEYIRTKIQSVRNGSQAIEPSENFAHKVMMGVIACEKKRTQQINACLVLIALAPFVIRELWMILRNDYFSLTSFPLHETFYSIYNFIMSPIAFFVFLGVGIIATMTIWTKRWKTIESVGTVKTT